MDKKDYLDNLKSVNMRPKRIKVESKETVLMEAELSNKEMELRKKLVKWLMKHPYPKDTAVHEYAQSIGIEESKLETEIYAILSSVLSEGKSKGKDVPHDPKELEMGIKVEMEHTPCPLIARKIALDHLVEIKDYYSRLKKMEKAAGINEIFVQVPEIESLPKGQERDAQMARLSMIAELDAVNTYKKFAMEASSKDLKKVLLSVAKEEMVHSGEFKTMLEKLDSEMNKAELDGKKEVDDMI